jgi:hypothetical protein
VFAAKLILILPAKAINLRLVAVCIAAASVGLSMAIVVMKLRLLVVGGLTTCWLMQRRNAHEFAPSYTSAVILVALTAFSAQHVLGDGAAWDAGSIAKIQRNDVGTGVDAS